MRRLAFHCLGILAATLCTFSIVPRSGSGQASNPLPPFQNSKLPLDDRVKDLVSRMTPDEKVSQMMNAAVAIDRLGIPSYDWWSECLHGVARAGIATVFPQSIGLASTWDQELLQEVASVISDEARAKYHEFIRRGMRARYDGPYILVSQHQPLSRPALGPRHGDLWRGSVPDGKNGGPVHSGTAGRRSSLSESGGHRQALRRAQRPGIDAAHFRCANQRTGLTRELPSALRSQHYRGSCLFRHVRIQQVRR